MEIQLLFIIPNWIGFVLIFMIPVSLVVWLFFDIRRKKTKDATKTFVYFGKYGKLFRVALIFLMMFFCFLITYRCFPFKTHFTALDKILAESIAHFDLAGIVIGLVGIIIGIITVIYVEIDHGRKEKINKEAIDEIRTLTRDLKLQITGLKEITNLKETFGAIKNVIQHAAARPLNKLQMLTYMTDYGQFLIRNVGVLIRESEQPSNDLRHISQRDFVEMYFKPLLKTKEELNSNLKDYVKKGKILEIAALKNSKLDKISRSRLRDFAKDRVMHDKLTILINQYGDERINFGDSDLSDSNLCNMFIHIPGVYDVAMEKLSNDIKEDYLINDLLGNDERLLDALNQSDNSRANSKLTAYALDYIPFQFFLSAPIDGTEGNPHWSAVFVFANYYQMGQEHGLICFTSTNQDLCRNLQKIFMRFVDLQKKKEARKPAIKEFFEGKELHFVLKNVQLDQREARHVGFTQVTAVPDIEAKDRIVSFLKEKEIKFDPQTIFLAADSPNPIKDRPNIAYFSIGLFYNRLSEYVSELPENSFFRLAKRVRFEGTLKNVLKIAKPGQPDFASFPEVFKENSKDVHDYTIFCKLVLKGQTVYIGGGINYFGTTVLDACISKYIDKIFDEVVYREFIAVFKTFKKEPIDPTLEHLIYMENGKPCKANVV